MDRIEFENKLLVRGADLDRWPAAEAEAAKHLLASDPKSRALLADLIATDNAIRAATAATVDVALVGRILAATQRPPARSSLWGGWRPMLPAGALAVLIIAASGFRAGYDDGFGRAEETDLAAIIAGDEYAQGNLP